jgi:hypothetical protein
LQGQHLVSRLTRVRAERVAQIPSCAECDARWLPADEERWRPYLTDDEPAELVFYCRRVRSGSSARTEAA